MNTSNTQTRHAIRPVGARRFWAAAATGFAALFVLPTLAVLGVS